MKDKAISHDNVFKLKNLIAPDHFPQIFNSTNSMYSYNLRNSNQNWFVPKPYTEAGKNSFHYRGAVLSAVLWNSQRNAVKGQTSSKLFLSHFVILEPF